MQLHLSSDGKAFVEGVRSAQRKAGRRNSASCQSAAKLGADRAGVDVRASAALICIARLRKASPRRDARLLTCSARRLSHLAASSSLHTHGFGRISSPDAHSQRCTTVTS